MNLDKFAAIVIIAMLAAGTTMAVMHVDQAYALAVFGAIVPVAWYANRKGGGGGPAANAVAVAGLGAIVAGLVACAAFAPTTPQTPREEARAAVLLVADGAKALDVACASFATSTANLPAAKVCADAYDYTRSSLLAAEAGIDAWESADKGQTACALAGAVAGLGRIKDVLDKAHVKVPAVVEDALRFAPLVTGACHG